MKVRQPDGTVKHVKRRKAAPFFATDVMPGRIYLARLWAYSADWEPVRVECVREPGWLRGLVKVDSFYTNSSGAYKARAYVRGVFGNNQHVMLVERRSFAQDWAFMDEEGGSLIEVPHSYFAEQRSAVLDQIEDLQRRLKNQIFHMEQLDQLEQEHV